MRVSRGKEVWCATSTAQWGVLHRTYPLQEGKIDEAHHADMNYSTALMLHSRISQVLYQDFRHKGVA